MKVKVPCPVTGRMLSVDIKEAKSEAEARARANHRLKQAAATFTESEKQNIRNRYNKQKQTLEQAQMVLASRLHSGLKNGQLDLMNLEALTRLMH
jgi:hypothetical protein